MNPEFLDCLKEEWRCLYIVQALSGSPHTPEKATTGQEVIAFALAM